MGTLGCVTLALALAPAVLAFACDATRGPLSPAGGAGGAGQPGTGGAGDMGCTFACPTIECLNGFLPSSGPCSCSACAPGGGGSGAEGTGGSGGGVCPNPHPCPEPEACLYGYQTTDPCGCSTCAPGDGGGADATPSRIAAAAIKVSRSTNSPEIDVIVYGDGSAERTVIGNPGVSSVVPESFPAGSPEGLALLTDLAAIGNDVSSIPTGACAKSVSFGTTTTISTDAKTSGDLQCLQNPSAADTALVAACNALL